jgi:transcriptional regulator with XRE-family HTH domain
MFPGRDAPEAEVREVRDDHFAVTLAILRIIRRMSQGELAERAAVTNSAVSDYERGKVDPQAVTLEKGDEAYPKLPAALLATRSRGILAPAALGGEET